MTHCSIIILCALAYLFIINAKQILELQGVNFELAITSYKYVAVLFHDKSSKGKELLEAWTKASLELDDLNSDSEIAKLDGNDPEMAEVIESYGINLPLIKVFRRGIMTEYRGPYDAKGISKFILEDSLPSVQIIQNLDEMKSTLKTQFKTVVLGFFKSNELIQDETDETFLLSVWGQFQAAADTLRGHAVFYAATSDDILDGFKLSHADLPLIYMIAEDSGNLLQYSGEILEIKLSDWVLKNSSPSMSELTLSSSAGEVFSAQFFSSMKLKFIILLTQSDMTSMTTVSDSNDSSISSVDDEDSDVFGSSLDTPIETWTNLSKYFKSKALFAYMVNDNVGDVLDFFQVNKNKDLPILVAHDPTTDAKYKSEHLDKITSKKLKDFVAGVITGYLPKIIKSEKIPSLSAPTHSNPVLPVVGNNVIDIVSQTDKDVLLEIYAPWCTHCKKLRSTLDILGRAVLAEDKILIAKIDGTANDLPTSWNLKSYPVLLWFPAKDKPYKSLNNIVPRPYWDAGYSLYEMMSFIQRETSFDVKSLKIATQEQLGQLLSEEDTLRAKYELEDKTAKRNEGRDIYENEMIDYLFGEVIFDGTRFHLGILGILIVFILILFLLVIASFSKSGAKAAKNTKNNKSSTEKKRKD